MARVQESEELRCVRCGYIWAEPEIAVFYRADSGKIVCDERVRSLAMELPTDELAELLECEEVTRYGN